MDYVLVGGLMLIGYLIAWAINNSIKQDLQQAVAAMQPASPPPPIDPNYPVDFCLPPEDCGPEPAVRGNNPADQLWSTCQRRRIRAYELCCKQHGLTADGRLLMPQPQQPQQPHAALTQALAVQQQKVQHAAQNNGAWQYHRHWHGGRR